MRNICLVTVFTFFALALSAQSLDLSFFKGIRYHQAFGSGAPGSIFIKNLTTTGLSVGPHWSFGKKAGVGISVLIEGALVRAQNSSYDNDPKGHYFGGQVTVAPFLGSKIKLVPSIGLIYQHSFWETENAYFGFDRLQRLNPDFNWLVSVGFGFRISWFKFGLESRVNPLKQYARPWSLTKPYELRLNVGVVIPL